MQLLVNFVQALLHVGAAFMMLALVPACVLAKSYSASETGSIGLNTIPTARTAPQGTIWAGASRGTPYMHSFLGLQVSDPLSITLRQSKNMSISGKQPTTDLGRISAPIIGEEKPLYNGIDTKIRLTKETEHIPQIAIGAQSALGHKRMAGEYIVASRGYKNWGFTAGLGWGRFAQGLTFDNPLGLLGGHFNKSRPQFDEHPNKPQDWFTGEKVGLFAGAEYFTPLKGLSLKLDLGADRLAPEATSQEINSKAAPWAVGANYQRSLGRYGDLNTAIAVQGIDKISLRVTLSQLIGKLWRTPVPPQNIKLGKHRPPNQVTMPKAIPISAERDHIWLTSAAEYPSQNAISADLFYNSAYSLPSQIARGAAHIAKNAAASIEKLTLKTSSLGLTGPIISLSRRTLERLKAHKTASASELWHSAEIVSASTQNMSLKDRLSLKRPENQSFLPFKLDLNQQISLTNDSATTLRRTSLVASTTITSPVKAIHTGIGLRANLHDNFHKYRPLNLLSLLPVRSDIADYSNKFLTLDHAYIAATHSFTPSLHALAMAGYLEEMYAGASAEILYRPYDKRYAIGANIYQAAKRDPDNYLKLDPFGMRGYGFKLSGYYHLPRQDIVLKTSLSRYLAGDKGIDIGFEKTFQNGARLSGFTALSNASDPDIYGGSTHLDHGLRLSIPVGGFKYTPDNACLNLEARPFGRDIAQHLNTPLNLYDLTTPLSLGHIEKHWHETAR